jgi:hypothetical protein
MALLGSFLGEDRVGAHQRYRADFGIGRPCEASPIRKQKVPCRVHRAGTAHVAERVFGSAQGYR